MLLTIHAQQRPFMLIPICEPDPVMAHLTFAQKNFVVIISSGKNDFPVFLILTASLVRSHRIV
jgi:hypothetical protein